MWKPRRRCSTPLPDELRLRHIVQYAEEALGYVAVSTRENLDDDPMLVHSLARCIEIIGEAASQVSESTRERFPQIPWRAAVGMRNRLIHSYFEIDLDRVWKTASVELEPLVRRIRESGVLDEPDGEPTPDA